MSTEELRAPRFGARVTRRVLAIIGVGLLPAIASFFAANDPALHWAAVVSFVSAGFVAGYVAWRELHRFRCPRCGALIPDHEPTHGAEGVAIKYWCRSCDLRWDTGLRTPDNI